VKEREANRRYQWEIGVSTLLYGGLLIASLYLAKPMEAGWERTLLLLTPAIPVFLMVWAIARHFRRMDEYMRMRSLESLAVATAVTAGLGVTYGFLESAGFPKLSMFWVWGVMGLVWGGHSALRCLFAR